MTALMRSFSKCIDIISAMDLREFCSISIQLKVSGKKATCPN